MLYNETSEDVFNFELPSFLKAEHKDIIEGKGYTVLQEEPISMISFEIPNFKDNFLEFGENSLKTLMRIFDKMDEICKKNGVLKIQVHFPSYIFSLE